MRHRNRFTEKTANFGGVDYSLRDLPPAPELSLIRTRKSGNMYVIKIETENYISYKPTGFNTKLEANRVLKAVCKDLECPWSSLASEFRTRTPATVFEVMCVFLAQNDSLHYRVCSYAFRSYVRDSMQVENPDPVSIEACMTKKKLHEYVKAQLAEGRSADALINIIKKFKFIFSDKNIYLYKHLRLPDLSFLKFLRFEELRGVSQSYVPIPQDCLKKMDSAARIKLRRENPHVWVTYWLMRKCGLRNSEVANIRWSWLVEFEPGKFEIQIIRRPDWKPKGAGGVVPVSGRIVRIIKKLFPPNSPEDYIIPRHCKSFIRDVVLKQINSFFKKYYTGGSKGAYKLRGEFGCKIAQMYGIDTAARLLRHSSIAITYKHYNAITERVPAL